MFLSRIDMEQMQPYVRAALADCQKMHRLVMGLFQSTRQEAAVLYRLRVKGVHVSLYIYSADEPSKERLLSGMTLTGPADMEPVLDGLKIGKILPFSLLTMPSKKIAEEGKNSRRRILRDPTERLEWLAKKAEANGFSLVSVQEISAGKQTGAHNGEQGGKMYLDTYEYQGVLMIRHEENFKNAMRNGIGPEKAYGLGMLLLG